MTTKYAYTRQLFKSSVHTEQGVYNNLLPPLWSPGDFPQGVERYLLRGHWPLCFRTMLMVALGKENVSACYMLDVGIELAMTFTILKAVLGLWSISATAMYVRARRRVIKAERAYREAEYMRRLERRAQAEKLAESNGLWTLDRANRWDRILDLPITIPR